MKSSDMTFDGVKAAVVLTLTAQVLDTKTVTLDSKVYTFQDSLTNVDGNVKIGSDASESIDNLVAAIMLGAGVGVAYATAMTLHPTVTAAAGAGLTMTATAKQGGTAGNSIDSLETLTNGSFAAATLLGGGPDTNTVEITISTEWAEVASLQFVGTFTGTIAIKGSVDGTNYVAVGVLSAADRSTVATTVTAAGVHELELAGLSKIQFSNSAWTTGSVVITVRSVRR